MVSAIAALVGIVMGWSLYQLASFFVRREYDQERKAWADERRELLNRIQAWEPPPAVVETKPSSLPEVEREDPVGYTVQELAVMGLVENSGGGFVDTTTKALFETLDDFREWRGWLAKKGLPADTSPDDVRAIGG